MAARQPCIITKTCKIDMRVSTWDGVLSGSLAAKFDKLLPWLPTYFLARTDRDKTAHPLDVYWYYPVAMASNQYVDDVEPQLAELDENLNPIHELWKIVRERLGIPVRLYECEYGANPFGCEGHPHYDSQRENVRPEHIAIIVYLNAQWDVAWGGETVVFNEAMDVFSATIPKPGCATILEGDPFHVARGVSRSCPLPRRVLVFKMWRLDNLMI